MSEPNVTQAGYDTLRAELARLRRTVLLLAVALVACVLWLARRTPSLPPVLSAERLNIVEPDGKFAFVLANSQRPAGGTMDGKVLMQGQEEERKGVPSFIFFDGKGDEVGGLLTGVQTSPDGYSAMRHLSLDGYKQDQTVVLAHYQSPSGSSAGLRISDRPQESMLDVLGQLGLQPGASRDELQAALQTLPEDGRAARLRELFGVSRLFIGSNPDRSASLVMRDGNGRPRILIAVPADGEPSIRILDADGKEVLKLPSS
jgi:hypothetical protein